MTSTVKTHFRRLQSAVEGGEASAIEAEHRSLVSKIDKAVQKGALHRNTGARKKARAAQARRQLTPSDQTGAPAARLRASVSASSSP